MDSGLVCMCPKQREWEVLRVSAWHLLSLLHGYPVLDLNMEFIPAPLCLGSFSHLHIINELVKQFCVENRELRAKVNQKEKDQSKLLFYFILCECPETTLVGVL